MKKFKDAPFAIVGINSDSTATLKKLVSDGTVTWRNFDAGTSGGAIAKKWGIHSWPTLFLLDKNGVIRHKNLHGKNLEKAIENLIKETPKSK